jgi:hypothetical protein
MLKHQALFLGNTACPASAPCEVGNIKTTFYIEIQPITENFIPEAMKVNGLSLENLKQNGISPYEEMSKFAAGSS